jgi:hypothetical protein
MRRAPAAVALLLAILTLSSPAASAVSAWSRAATDVVTMLRHVLGGTAPNADNQSCVPPRLPAHDDERPVKTRR